MKELGIGNICDEGEDKKKMNAEKEHRKKTFCRNAQPRRVDQRCKQVTYRSPGVDIPSDYRKPEAFHDDSCAEDEKEEEQTDEILGTIIQPGRTGDVSAEECQNQGSQPEQGNDIQKK